MPRASIDLGENLVPGRQGVLLVVADEPLVVIGLGVQVLGQAAQPVLLGKNTSRTEHAPRAEGRDRSVGVEAGGPGGQQGVQAPVHAERDRVSAAPCLGGGVGVGEVGPHPAPVDAQGGQVQHRTDYCCATATDIFPFLGSDTSSTFSHAPITSRYGKVLPYRRTRLTSCIHHSFRTARPVPSARPDRLRRTH
ncbi:hypothetical protein [Streptomyces sp. NBC_00019]|uniref:hypothetical protein n=1 Tax=Streptomyces sp. NBC_00019 TaxID=2975623 RepID=UPI003248F75F